MKTKSPQTIDEILEGYLSPTEAADEIGCTRPTVYQYRDGGLFPGWKTLGGRSFIPRKEVEFVRDNPSNHGRRRKNQKINSLDS